MAASDRAGVEDSGASAWLASACAHTVRFDSQHPEQVIQLHPSLPHSWQREQQGSREALQQQITHALPTER